MNKRDRSMANSRSEAKRIFNQRQAIRRLERENKNLKDSINKAVEIIKNDWDYDDNDFEGRRFQKDILEALEVDYNDVW